MGLLNTLDRFFPDEQIMGLLGRRQPQAQPIGVSQLPPALPTGSPVPQRGPKGPSFFRVLDEVLGGKTITQARDDWKAKQANAPLVDLQRRLALEAGQRQITGYSAADKMGMTPEEQVALAFNPQKFGEQLATGSQRATLGRNDRSIFRGTEVARNDAPADPQVVDKALVGADGVPLYTAPQYETVSKDSRLVETRPGMVGGVPAAGQPSEGTRADRNANPGNIEDGPFARSQPGYMGGDGRFARFASPEHGRAAQVALLQSYARRGLNTVQGIVGRWAPASDGNNVSNYAQFVAQKLGVRPDQPLDMANPAVVQQLAAAMGTFEGAGSGATGGPRVVVDTASSDASVETPPGLKKIGNGVWEDAVGRKYQADGNGNMKQTYGVTDAVVAKSTENVTGLNVALASIDKFDQAVRALKPSEFGPLGNYTGDQAKFAAAKAAATELMMTMKSPAMFNLGVITGPDMEILEGVIENPSKWGSMIRKNQIVPKLRSLATGIGVKHRAELASFRALGGKAEGLPPLYKSTQGRGGKPPAPSPMTYADAAKEARYQAWLRANDGR
jgi:hypothetical protein